MAKMISLFTLIIGSCFSSQAQDSTSGMTTAADTSKPAASPTPTITGSVDLYYRYNFANSKTSFNNLTSFTNSQNSFELGMASIRADHPGGKPAPRSIWVSGAGHRSFLTTMVRETRFFHWRM